MSHIQAFYISALVLLAIFFTPENVLGVQYFEIDGTGTYTYNAPDYPSSDPAVTESGPVQVVLAFDSSLGAAYSGNSVEAVGTSTNPAGNPITFVGIYINGKDITNQISGKYALPYVATYGLVDFQQQMFEGKPSEVGGSFAFTTYYANPNYPSYPTATPAPGTTVTENGYSNIGFQIYTSAIAIEGAQLTTGLTARKSDGFNILSQFTYPSGTDNVGDILYSWGSASLTVNVTGSQALAGPNPKNLGDPNDRPGGVQGGDPIDIATGNVYRKVTDYQSSGLNKLTFERYYNSMGVLTNPGTHSKTLGVNWRSTYDRYLIINTSGAAGTALAERPDGQVLTFTLNKGVWTTDSDVNFQLSQSGMTWKLTTGDDTVETYTNTTTSGVTVLASIKARDGYTQTLVSNPSGQLTSVTDSNSRTLQFTYQNGLLTSITTPDTLVLQYGYSSSGSTGTALDRLTSVTYPSTPATSWTYVYGNTAYPFALTSETDELQNTYTTWTYDGQGRGTSVQQASAANSTQITYSAEGSSTVTGPLGEVDTYKFTTLQGVSKVTKIDRAVNGTHAAASELITYDRYGYVASVKDWNGNLTTSIHDTRGNELSHTLAAGTRLAEATTTRWHTLFHLPLEIIAPLETTIFTYDTHGNMLSRTVSANAESRTWSYTYNATGEVLTAHDPLRHLTTYDYDAQGNLASVEDALSHITSITSTNANGWPLTLQDPNGLITQLSYDVRGNLTSRIVGAELTEYTYDAANNLTQVTLPDNSYLAYSYDKAHRLTGITDPVGNSIAYTLDAMGNRTGTDVYDPADTLVQTSTQVFDALSHLAQIIGAYSGETTLYVSDGNGNQTNITDPLKNTTSSLYDALNRLAQTTDPKSGVTLYGYDAHNRLTSVTDPRKLKTSYIYTGPNNLVAIRSPDTLSTAMSYDSAGNVKTSTTARGEVFYAYDALNRLTTKTLPRRQIISYAYDQGTNGLGHMTSMKDLSGSTAWQYDQHGRVIEKDQTVGAVTLASKISYDAAGRVQTVTYPSGHVITNLYDPISGKLTGIQLDGQAVTSSATFQPFGPVASWVEGNSDAYARTFDLDGRLSAISVTGTGRESITETYGYDANGRIQGIADSLLSESGVFGYDALNRLTSVSGSFSESFTYDANGNRSSLTTPTGTKVYGYSRTSNWLTSTTAAAVQANKYDASGDLISDGTHIFTYDALGEMTEVAVGRVTEAQYTFNGLGQRVMKSGPSVADGAVIFVYDASGRLIGEYGPTGTPIEETIWLGNLPVGVIESGTLYYINPDQLGAPHSITDQGGNIVWQWTPEPFGNSAPVQAAGFTYNLRFPGQYADAETGLYYNNARSYNPASGRYVQSDPIGLMGGANTFTYVLNNPSNGFDVFGLSTYVVNRDLEIVRGSSRPRWDPLTHTFTAITNPDGSIAATFSWGNSANLTGWNMNEALDMNAAREAIQNGEAEFAGGSDFDPYVIQAYTQLDNPLFRHTNFMVTSNCKSETNNLVATATYLQMTNPWLFTPAGAMMLSFP